MSTKKSTIDNEFPERLRLFIEKDLGMKQGDFAKKIGITPGYLSMVITKKRGPSAEMIAGLHVNYRDNLTWLLTGERPKQTEEKIRPRFGTQEQSGKFEILNEAEKWLTELTQRNPDRKAWFELNLLDSFPAFKKWRQKRDEEESYEDESGSRKVA
ncbi:MAG: helix-turn-helix domain-containing protein [Desulfobulbus sp.]